MAKKKRSWKKKLGKALMAGAALAGGLALAKRGKGTGLTGSNKFLMSGAAGGARYPMDSAKAKRLMTTDAAYAPVMPDHLTHTMGATGPADMRGSGHPIIRGNVVRSRMFPGTYKSGGRVRGAGKAKRGLGRAFSKGRK